MKKKQLAVLALVIVAGGLTIVKAQSLSANSSDSKQNLENKSKKILYFNPEVFHNVEEIVEPTNTAFFSAVSDKISSLRNNKMMRADSPIEFDNIDAETIKEYCLNNNADFAVIPSVHSFFVGLGKYVF